MKNLLNLLERFSNSLNKDTLTKEIITRTLKEEVGIQIDPEKISLKEGVLSIEASPIVKNEINLKEEILKNKLKKLLNLSTLNILYK